MFLVRLIEVAASEYIGPYLVALSESWMTIFRQLSNFLICYHASFDALLSERLWVQVDL